MPEEVLSTNYDDEPVVYCSRCFSLKIQHEDIFDTDCCLDCGCTDTKVASFEEWERKYEQKYGHKFVVRGKDPMKSHIFKLPIIKLMDKVIGCPSWRKIIFTLYPHFPQGLSKEDSVVMLFDKLSKDNRMNDLKFLLFNMKV